jgi:hypothetical protein
MRPMTLVCWDDGKMRMQHLVLLMMTMRNVPITDVEDPTSLPVYDAYDEGGSSVIAPTHDEDSTPYPIYDMYDDAGMIVPDMTKVGSYAWRMTMKGMNWWMKSCMRMIVHMSPIIAWYHLVSQLVPCVTTHAMLMK